MSSHYFFKDGFNIIIRSRRNLPSNVNYNVTCGLGNTSTDSQYQGLPKLFTEVRRRVLGIDHPLCMQFINVMGLHNVLRPTQKLKNTCWPLRRWKQYSPQPIAGHGNTIMKCHISATIAFTDTTLLYRKHARSKLAQR